MTFLRRWKAVLLPEYLEGNSETTIPSKRYRRFRITLRLAMISISIIPLILTASLGYFQYLDLLNQGERDQLAWKLESAEKTIDAFIIKLQSVIQFVAREDRYKELLDPNEVTSLSNRLKKIYTGFVDLGVIDSNGIQRSYAGPYDLQGYDYSGQEWFDEAKRQEVYISNVFLGFRKVPHFVVAVNRTIPGTNDHWILRATIDAETLQQFISRINTKAEDDIFIINDAGILQTSSAFFGRVLDRFSLNPEKIGSKPVRNFASDTNNVLQASVKLKNSPWTLVIIKKGYIHGKAWSSFRTKLFITFFLSSILSLLVIFYLVNFLTNHIMSSDRKRQALLAEAEHSSKLASIGRLAAGVAHEINNPLAIIDQKAGLIQDLLEITDDFTHKTKLMESINGVINGVHRCKVITHRLLGFARKMDVSYEDININELLREVLSFLEREALYNNIQLNLSLDEELARIHSDRGQLQQIFLNIINNAIDAVGRDGTILIATGMHGPDAVEIEICDNGPGIPPEAIQHIFDPFFTTKETGKGTGLGLSITYGLVKQLGGQIKVNSSIGKGATFLVRLPVRPVNNEAIKK